MSVQNRSDLTNYPFILSGASFVREGLTLLQDAGRSTVLAVLTVMGQVAVSAPTIGTADTGNTGDGTVTGVALAIGDVPRAGTFELECTAIGADAASGTAVYVGTGDGTASAVVVGAETIVGDYLVTCIDATVSGSEIFEVIDPNGVALETLTVGVAYLNAHFGLTLTDGLTDFTVGDVWTLTMIVGHGGTFKLTDPGANVLASDLVLTAGADAVTTFVVPDAGLTFIITDGSADFIAGDVFTIDIVAVNKWVPFDLDAINGAQVPRGSLLVDSVTAAALVEGDVADQAILVGGGCCTVDSEQIVFESGATLDTVLVGGRTVRDELDSIGIFTEDTIAIDEFEN